MYIPRLIDAELAKTLKAVGGVVIEGPRFCGKTTTAKQIARSSVALDADAGLRTIAQTDPSLILAGEAPRLIDEWQVVPSIWNAVRHEIDSRREKGQFILTGSAVPMDDATRHSGAGRFARIIMETMTLAEQGVTAPVISFAGLFAGTAVNSALDGPGVTDYIEYMLRGGWPGLVGGDEESARVVLTNYVDEIARLDISAPNGTAHDPMRVRALLRSLARNTSNEFPYSKLAVEANKGGKPLSEQSVRNYMDALRRIHILKDQPAWNTHLRSRVRLISNPKRHLADPSIALAAIGATKEKLLRDGNALGFFFESLVIHDLRAYSAPLGGDVFHYRDSSGLEADAIIELRDSTWAGIEVKMPQSDIDIAAAHLLALKHKLTVNTQKRCAFLAVITSGRVSYVRPDNVRVIALGHLGP
jgi:predicted AAA+ superfamily ATPase